MSGLDKCNHSNDIIGNFPDNMSFDNTNEALDGSDRQLADQPHIFSNTNPPESYNWLLTYTEKRYGKILLDYKGLENKNNGKEGIPSFDFSDTFALGNGGVRKSNNVCNLSHDKKYDIGYNINNGFTASDSQKVAGYETPLCGLASAMRLLRGKYNNKSLTEITHDGYQGYYKGDEELRLSATRLIRISHNSSRLHLNPNDKLNLNNPDSLKYLSASIAKGETSTQLTKEFVDKAYLLAFPEEQGEKGILYDYDGNISYEGELLNGKENGRGKKYENGYVYDGKWINGEFVNGTVMNNDGKVIIMIHDGSSVDLKAFRGEITNEMLNCIEKNIKNSSKDINWQGQRGNIEFDWNTNMIKSRGNEVELQEMTVDIIKLNGLNLELSRGGGMWLANFKNWFKCNYKGKKVKFEASYINKNFDWNRTFHVDNTMLIRRKDIEKHIPICSDDSVMEKICEWLNK